MDSTTLDTDIPDTTRDTDSTTADTDITNTTVGTDTPDADMDTTRDTPPRRPAEATALSTLTSMVWTSLPADPMRLPDHTQPTTADTDMPDVDTDTAVRTVSTTILMSILVEKALCALIGFYRQERIKGPLQPYL